MTNAFPCHFGAVLKLPNAAVGPLVPGMLGALGIEPVSVHLFPVAASHLGAPPASLWESRRSAVRAAIDKAPDESLRRLGGDYLKAIEQYARDAASAGPAFVGSAGRVPVVAGPGWE